MTSYQEEIRSLQFFKDLTKLPFIEIIYLYGSRARGDHKNRSDIDLAVVCPQASDDDWYLVLDLVDKADTLLKIDCVRFDRLADNNPLKKSIVSDGVILYQKEKK
ncbi:nucleotidyltransferase domain-containing protein [Candidatus Dependentiae bacterium]|jgi:predicted nucleotidyltransferase|nr:nucleotidyltransferase domain-containing protein [Candidatus Dependentiae bacterium]